MRVFVNGNRELMVQCHPVKFAPGHKTACMEMGCNFHARFVWEICATCTSASQNADRERRMEEFGNSVHRSVAKKRFCTAMHGTSNDIDQVRFQISRVLHI